jgi:hypothetical protein
MINISGYDVIYKEIVYKCVDMNLIFDGVELSSKPIAKLQFLDVACINQDGEVILIHDESFMFRFIRKAGAKGYE